MKLGFRFRETMAGTYHLLSAPTDERPMSFTVAVRSPSIVRFALSPVCEMQGEVDAIGFADHKPLRGTVEINPLIKRRLVYEFRFPGNDGEEYRFHGKKSVSALHLADSMTTLPAAIWREEREVARALLRFDLESDLVKFVLGFRRA
ncbi:MAG: hypothetical protein IT379_01410 [Deltaproteobacteria bacterium]|nr:hypothetical protein [Deltaproteobacteria bacterium]